MHYKVFFMGLFFLLGSCSPDLLAGQNAHLPRKTHSFKVVLQENLEGSFKMKSGPLLVSKGKRKACFEANHFVSAAVKTQKICLESLDYEVAVKKLVTGYVKRYAKGEPLVVYQYTITINSENGNGNYIRFVKQLESKRYITRIVSGFEAPITCHYLTVKGHLVLLSYYGSMLYYKDFEPEELIAWLREGRD